ncbi:ROK family protein [Cohnella panacarvi]|uniref:ROK family protein n=1 Tax=Cohnella panacarvi TaxID=400776 RepID=UPI0004789B87|nr:ROK family protein [Cohnella panacarvi]
MKAFLVMDIGGTYFRSGSYLESGVLVDVKKVNSDNFINLPDITIEQMQQDFLESITRIVEEYKLSNDYRITGLGISFPGPVTDEGVVREAPTLWGNTSSEFPLRHLLQLRFSDLEVIVMNDVTAAGWRYVKSKSDRFCIITVSSGIGNKVFWNGEVLIDSNGSGGEIGHSYYGGRFKELVCDCGCKGHLGAISSGRGVEKVGEYLKNEYPEQFTLSLLSHSPKITTFEMIKALAAEDDFAKIILDESIKPLAHSMSFICQLIGIKRFVIIGGFAIAVGNPYIETLKRHLNELHEFQKDTEIEIVFGENDDNHGLIGLGKYINVVEGNGRLC